MYIIRFESECSSKFRIPISAHLPLKIDALIFIVLFCFLNALLDYSYTHMEITNRNLECISSPVFCVLRVTIHIYPFFLMLANDYGHTYTVHDHEKISAARWASTCWTE